MTHSCCKNVAFCFVLFSYHQSVWAFPASNTITIVVRSHWMTDISHPSCHIRSSPFTDKNHISQSFSPFHWIWQQQLPYCMYWVIPKEIHFDQRHCIHWRVHTVALCEVHVMAVMNWNNLSVKKKEKEINKYQHDLIFIWNTKGIWQLLL